MKKHHIILILLFAGIAAYFLYEARNLQGNEAIASEELNLLREVVKKSPGAATASTLTGKSSRPPAIDSAKFTAELTDILKAGPSPENGEKLQELLTAYGPQLESAPLSKLKEISDFLEKNFPFDQSGTEGAQLVWFGVVRLAAKYDPAWAFANLDQAASNSKIPLNMQLGMFKNMPNPNGEPMSPGYAAALQKWLDAAQAAGRIEEIDPLVTELRADIAAAQGDQSAVVKQISQLPNQSQRKTAMDYLKGLPTPEAQRKGMEELSTVLDFYNFTAAVRSLADQQGFDAARAILSSASLTPDKYDMAAASIAAANIGPDTPARAKWLLESLRSKDKRALIEFTDQWAHADYQGAAQWLGTIPAGKQRDIAISGFAPAAAKIDGATAVDWALTLTDPNERRSCVDDVVRKWRETDAEAAAAYLKEKGLPVR